MKPHPRGLEGGRDGDSDQGGAESKQMNIERWGWYSIGVNIVLIAINAGIALASGSLAVEAEMVHNLVDLLTAVGVLIGLKLSTRKSKDFPYGLYKLEKYLLNNLGQDMMGTLAHISASILYA